MDVFANNLIFREKKRKITIFLRKEAKKRNLKEKRKRGEIGCQKYFFTCTGIKIFPQWAIAVISKKLVGNKLWNGRQLPNWPPPGYANATG